MLGANLGLFVLWLFTYLFVHEIFGSFKLIQKDCEDPAGTKLLFISTTIFLGLAVCVIAVLFFTIRLVFDNSRHSDRWTRAIVPGIFSGIFFILWVTLLWVSYSMAARPDSSLLASSEEAATFPTVLSIALSAKPIFDIVKAFTKKYKAKRRDARGQKKRMSSHHSYPEAGVIPPTGPTSTVRPHSRVELHHEQPVRHDNSGHEDPSVPRPCTSPSLSSSRAQLPDRLHNERRNSEIGSNDDGSSFSGSDTEENQQPRLIHG
ncbi:hypothetical protein JCM11251_002384 [Rhodosporidiobolus azoricus]